MAIKRSTWIGRRAEVLVRLYLKDSSGCPGELLYPSGRSVIIKKYHPKNRINSFSFFTVSNLKGGNLVEIPIYVLALTDRPETTSDRIWTFLKGYPDGATQAQIVQNLGLKAKTVVTTCDNLMIRGVLSYLDSHHLGPSKIRPFCFAKISPEGRKTAFERLAEKDLF